MRILIIEDSDAIRRMIEALMRARGHDVTAFANGSRGLEEALANPPDAVLLDLNLPGTYDGFDVCRKLREEPMTKGTPVIIISASGDEESKTHALAAGANAYYTKPFSPTALLKELEAFRTRQKSVP
jgi:DNA-binding response OmpR family regulator